MTRLKRNLIQYVDESRPCRRAAQALDNLVRLAQNPSVAAPTYKQHVGWPMVWQMVKVLLSGLICVLPVLALGCNTIAAPADALVETTSDLVETTSDLTFRLSEDLDMDVGQTARLEGTDIQVTLISAHGPSPGEYDTPNTAAIVVRSAKESEELGYAFAGNMLYEALVEAKRKTAFGFVFIAVRIVEGAITIRVEPDRE